MLDVALHAGLVIHVLLTFDPLDMQGAAAKRCTADNAKSETPTTANFLCQSNQSSQSNQKRG